MQRLIRALAAIRFAWSTRRDLLEILALRHQLAVRARPNRRLHASDRLLWLTLRRVWPRWRDALVLVQPATVDRWKRARFVRRWWRRSRRPGRPRIDSTCRDLIARLAADENRLWGAPRIHGELLKLGVGVSERTVSRYLRERPNRPSQTWRTFIANHLGQFECNTQLLSPEVSDDDLIDAFPSTCRSLSADRLPASKQCAPLDGRVSVRRAGLGLPCTQDHLCDPTGMRRNAGRAPPRIGFFAVDARRREGLPAVTVEQFRPTARTATVTRVRPCVSPTAIGTSIIGTVAICASYAWERLLDESRGRTVGILAKHRAVEDDVLCEQSLTWVSVANSQVVLQTQAKNVVAFLDSIDGTSPHRLIHPVPGHRPH